MLHCLVFWVIHKLLTGMTMPTNTLLICLVPWAIGCKVSAVVTIKSCINNFPGKTSRSQDVAISLFSQEKISEKYPWLNAEGVALASDGTIEWIFLIYIAEC